MNINDEKDLRPSPKTRPKTRPINTNTRPRQLSPFNDQSADFREPPPPLSGRNSLKASFHLTISMRGQRATGKIQRNNYHHGSCGRSLTGKTMSVFLIFTQGTHRNVKNR